MSWCKPEMKLVHIKRSLNPSHQLRVWVAALGWCFGIWKGSDSERDYHLSWFPSFPPPKKKTKRHLESVATTLLPLQASQIAKATLWCLRLPLCFRWWVDGIFSGELMPIPHLTLGHICIFNGLKTGQKQWEKLRLRLVAKHWGLKVGRKLELNIHKSMRFVSTSSVDVVEKLDLQSEKLLFGGFCYWARPILFTVSPKHQTTWRWTKAWALVQTTAWNWPLPTSQRMPWVATPSPCHSPSNHELHKEPWDLLKYMPLAKIGNDEIMERSWSHKL